MNLEDVYREIFLHIYGKDCVASELRDAVWDFVYDNLRPKYEEEKRREREDEARRLILESIMGILTHDEGEKLSRLLCYCKACKALLDGQRVVQ